MTLTPLYPHVDVFVAKASGEDFKVPLGSLTDVVLDKLQLGDIVQVMHQISEPTGARNAASQWIKVDDGWAVN